MTQNNTMLCYYFQAYNDFLVWHTYDPFSKAHNMTLLVKHTI